jgi:hypothetical protein
MKLESLHSMQLPWLAPPLLLLLLLLLLPHSQ